MRGEPLVVHAARRLLGARTAEGEPVVHALVVTAPAGLVEEFCAALEPLSRALDLPGPTGVPGPTARPAVRVVVGGASRQASVAAGLATLPPEVDVVLVHDAARPFAPGDLVVRVVDAVRAGHRAVVPGLPVVDTVKQIDPLTHVDAATQGDGPAEAGDPAVVGWAVRATVPRDTLRAVQTPQGFDRALLDRAHAAAAAHAHDEAVAASDDAGLVERLGEPVWVVPGDERAAKITTARDLVIAELLGDDRAPV
ncbi:hypothetical protein GCM10022273_01770 [Cellulomonas soli]